MFKKTAFAVSILLLFLNIQAANADEITVAGVRGKVEYYDLKKEAWAELKEGLKLKKASSIKTGPGSSCDFKIKDHAFRLKENSTLVLTDINPKKSIRLNLLSGEILNKIKKLPTDSSFSLETPEAVCGVRGTCFSASRRDGIGTEVFVAEEFVCVESRDIENKSVSCGENEKVEVSPWRWALYEARGKSGKKEPAAGAVEVSEEDYISRFGPDMRIDKFRVAQLDAYRNLAEKIYGTVIKTKETLRDYSKDDIVVKKVEGIVRGAETAETKFYSDGNVEIGMVIKGSVVVDELKPDAGDIFGENYLSSPEVVEIKGFEQYLELENL